MIDHKTLLCLTVVEHPKDGSFNIVYSALDKDNILKNHFEKLFGLKNVHPAFTNLLGASVTMYQQLEHCSKVFQNLEERAVKSSHENVAAFLQQEVASIKLMQRIALEGASSVLDRKVP